MIPKPELQKQFFQLFGAPVNHYWDITGFDIVKFDKEVIKTPDDESMMEFIENKYGQKGVRIIEQIMR